MRTIFSGRHDLVKEALVQPSFDRFAAVPDGVRIVKYAGWGAVRRNVRILTWSRVSTTPDSIRRSRR